MAPLGATARIILIVSFFFLLLSVLSSHVSATTPPLSFSFDFSKNSSYSLADLRFEGDAVLNGDLVDLTCNSNTTFFCSGRMSYNHPVTFYDNNTGEVASFVTTFTFAINWFPNRTQRADGMTFFLSGYPSKLPQGSSNNLLGLTNSSQYIPSGPDRYVALEFDTYENPWDPPVCSDHIGIDVNSISSVIATRLPTNSLNGTMTATITFNNTTHMLEATLHFDANPSLAPATVKTVLPDKLDDLLPAEVAVGFSAGTGGHSELHQIYSWTFNSTMASRAGHRVRALVITGAVLFVLAVLALLLRWWILSWCRQKQKQTLDFFAKATRLRRYEYRDLSSATDRFSNKLGKGGFGIVYRGNLENKEVAVKKIHHVSRGEFKDPSEKYKEFLGELAAADKLAHGNVVKTEGWSCNISDFMFWCMYRQTIEFYLVFEFVPNGNLDEHLHPDKPQETLGIKEDKQNKTSGKKEDKQHKTPEVLSWARRYTIVGGLCSALHYLHHQCKPYMLHRDIKPANILLDEEFNPKLADFGLSRAAKHSETSVPTQSAIGSFNYMDPACMKHGTVNFSRGSDIYSFGVVLLEIAHGENKLDLVRKLHRDRPETFVKDIADKRLADQFDKTQMERVILLGLRCCEPDTSQRPSLIGATQFLKYGGVLPPAMTRDDEPTQQVPLPPS